MDRQKPKLALFVIVGLILLTLFTSFSYLGYVAKTLTNGPAVHMQEVATQDANLIAPQSPSNMDTMRANIIKGTMLFIFFIAILFVAVLIYIFQSHKKASMEIAKLAYYDTLTGAPNAEKFRLDARSLIHRYGASRYILLYMDTRRFRFFNKDFGYEAGDEYLIHMAKVLGEAVTENETFARISGDMFVLLHRRKDSSDTGTELWINLQDRIVHCPMVNDNRYTLRLNCGVYELTRDITNVQTAIDRANIARKALKDRYDIDIIVYNEDMQQQIDNEKEIEQCMHAALEHDEFTPYMQPKYNLEDGTVVGAEALVRWIRHDGTIIPPDEFIPLFEKNGFILELDLYMLESVCSYMRAQIDSGICPVPTSINQSRCYMYNQDYVETICAIIEKYNIPPRLIEFEITENIAYKNMDKLILVIEKLSANGFQLSLDDFGSGYSSLNVLKDLRVHVLKLDRVFLGKTIDTERGKTVIANIIRMAKELSIDVVAEGVETAEQVDFLRSSNCDMAQGFYFSRPVPMENFEAMLERQEETVTV
ncbi:MAG: GGDEF domain-containing phosphodiesterase [Angelakisella sp.]